MEGESDKVKQLLEYILSKPVNFHSKRHSGLYFVQSSHYINGLLRRQRQGNRLSVNLMTSSVRRI